MSDEKKYYCFCGSNCKYETLTREQILSVIEQAAAGSLTFDTSAAFITKVKEQNGGGYITFWVGTQAQYNALAEKDQNCFYLVTDSTKDADVARKIAAKQDALDWVTDADIDAMFAGTYEGSENYEAVDSPLPIVVLTEADMTALLETAEVGSVYKYAGESGTYENGALYIVGEN